MSSLHLFLGANSASGFHSLYGGLTGGRFDDCLILKGGPGCGKSTLMRRCADAAEERGERVVYIHCSGDPASLDGAVFPDRRCAIVDGTPPHALEPTYAVACERCVDLTRFYDVAAVKARRAELRALTDAYRAHYRDAYRLLRAAEEAAQERRALLHERFAHDALRRRIDALLSRELRAAGRGSGRVDRAFLGGVTHLGDLCRFDTAAALCPRLYLLDDSAGLAASALLQIADAARARGDDVLLCPDPDRPRLPAHVLLPARGLAFVTTNARCPYDGPTPCRRLRLDAPALSALSRAEKTRLRFLRRVEDGLREEAVAALARAKSSHDALEACYRPCVDFSAVTALADEEIARLFAE